MVEFPPCDYSDVDVEQEALEGHQFHIHTAIRETFYGMFFPLTVPLVFWLHGRLACEMHCWWLSKDAEADGLKEFRRLYHRNSGGFSPLRNFLMEYACFAVTGLIMMTGTALYMCGQLSHESPVIPDLVLGWLFIFFLSSIKGGIKYGYRSTSAKVRLIDHISRRNEEFSFGWYHMPDEWVLFLVRLCMAEVQLPMDAYVLLETRNKHPASSADAPATATAERPSFEESERLVPAQVAAVVSDSNGRLKVPVLVVMLELALPLRGKVGDDKLSSPSREAQGNLGLLYRVMVIPCFCTALLPTILRWYFLEKHWDYTPFEIAIVSASAVLVFLGSVFVTMIINACSLVIARRLRLMNSLAGLVDGTGNVLGEWRMASKASQFELWDNMRRAFVNFGRNYERRAVASFSLLFVSLVSFKMFVFYMFVLNAMQEEEWHVKEEPVTPGFLVFFPLIFTLPMVVALLKGAELNDSAKPRLMGALLKRARECVVEREVHLDAHGVDAAEKHMEYVQFALEMITSSVAIAKPMVLLGDRGSGLFTFSYGLVVSFLSENVVNLALMAQVVTFD